MKILLISIKTMAFQLRIYRLFLRRNFYLLLIIIFSTSGIITKKLHAQKLKYNIEHIGIEHGLSQGSIYSMHKTPDGIMWFGSLDGLNVYNGKNIRVFKPNKNDPFAINGREVKKIINDTQGRVWIGTEYGLNVFNPATSGFKKIVFTDLKNQKIATETYPLWVENNTIWVWLSNYGLISYDLETKTQTFRIHEKGFSSNYFQVTASPEVDKNQNFWILTNEFLLKYNFRRKSLEKLSLKTIFKSELPQIFHFDINENNYIFSTEEGVRIVNRTNYSTINISKVDENESLGNVYDIESDAKGNIWIATEAQGLVYYDISKNTIDRITSDNSSSSFNIFTNEIAYIYLDPDGILWANTDPFGVDKIRLLPGNFDYFKIKKVFSNDNSNYSIRGITIHNKRLYLGTQQAGFFEIDTSNFNIKKQFLMPQIPSNTIRNIFVDSQNTMWIGTTEGLSFYQNNKIQNLDLKSGSITGRFVRTISESDNKIWIGTEEGLASVDLKNNNYVRRVPNFKYRISLIFHKTDSTAIVGTFDNSLIEFDIKNLKIIRKIPFNGIPTTFKTHNGYFWIGTSGGLIKTDASLKKIEIIEKLKDEFIYGLEVDADGIFWISCNNGIIKYNPKTDQIFRFNQNDGVQSLEFNGYSTFKDTNGRIYMGGIRGLNYFLPKQINTPPAEPSNILTEGTKKLKIKDFYYFINEGIIENNISSDNEAFNNKFKTLKSKIPNFSYTKNGVWLKFEFRNKTTNQWLMEIFNSRIDSLKVWVFERNLPLKYFDSANNNILSGNELISPNPAINLDLIANQDYTVYIYAKTKKDLKLPVTFFDSNSYLKRQYSLNLLWGIYIGFFLLISIYNIFLYLTIKEPTYIFYSFYILFFGAFQISLYGIGKQYFNQASYLDGNLYFIFLFLSNIFLVLFTDSFLQLGKQFGKTWEWVKKTLLVWSIFWATIPIIFFEYWFNYIAILSGIMYTSIFFYISYIYIKQSKAIIYYYGLATLFLAIASTITGFQNLNLLLPDYQEYIIMAGSMLEIVLFSVALGYKIRQNQLEKEKQQSLRNEISANLHDDLAASLSSLTMYSELSKRKIGKEVTDLGNRFDLISQKSREILSKVREAVYELNPENDQENEWLERIIDFGRDIFDSKDIDFSVNIPADFENHQLNVSKRKDIVLIFKEIMNNSAKYSEATKVLINLNKTGNKLEFEYIENGKGFDSEKIKAGNGLKNIFERANKIKSVVVLDTKPGKGTTYRLTTYLN